MREKMVNPFLHGKWGFGLLLCAFFFLIGGAVPALAGWVQTPEYRYIGEDGSYLRDEWVEENGNRFYLDEDGKLVTGFYTFEDGTECFFGPGGYLQTGLFQVDGRTYLADGDGVLLYGERIVNGEACVFTEDGLVSGDVRAVNGNCFYTENGNVLMERDVHFGQNTEHLNQLAVLTALLCGFFLILFRRRIPDWREKALLFAAVVMASGPMFLPYLMYGHDFQFHIARILGIAQAFREGMFPARLDLFSFNGYGYASPVFYPSLFLYFPALLEALGVTVVDAVNVWLFLCNLATAASMYYSASRLFCSARIGCLASILYTLGIYRLGNFYTRAAYGELTAMIFLPLVILGFYEVFFRDEKKWPLLLLAVTGVVQSHIISTVMVAAGCAIGGLFCIRRLADRKRLLAVLKAAGMAVLLNLWFLVPLLDYMHAGIDVEFVQYPAQLYAMPAVKLLELFPIDMGATTLDGSGIYDTMALGPGLPVLAAAGVGLYQVLEAKRTGGKLRISRNFLIAGAILLFAATSLFPWKLLMETPLSLIGEYLQFPWRLVEPALCLLSMAGGYAVCRQWGKRAGSGYSLLLGALLFCMVFSQHLVDSFYQNVDYWWDSREADSMLKQREYLFADVNVERAKGSRLPAGEGLAITDSEKDGLTVTFSYETDQPGVERFADLPLFYYPGYRAQDQDGNALPVIRGEDGLARVHFAAQEEGQIRVFFKERRLWRASELISLLSAAGLILWLAERKRREKKETGRRQTPAGQET